VSTALVELTEGVGTCGVIEFEQPYEARVPDWPSLADDASRSGLIVAFVRIPHRDLETTRHD
jgi:hypothetical protein